MNFRAPLSACTAAVLLLAGCVPMSQFTEVRDDRDALDQSASELTEQVQSLRLAVGEKDGQLREDARRIADLESDTSDAGRRLRQCQLRNGELEELNALLTADLENNRSSSGAKQSALLAELQRIRASLQLQQDSLHALEQDLKAREAKVTELSQMLDAQKAAGAALKERLSDALFGFRNKGLEVEERDGKVYVLLSSNLLFASGSTAIDPEGKQALSDLARAIEDEDDLEVVVEGHTDDVAFSSAASPRNNWELSVLRATAVVEVLSSSSNLKPEVLTAAGRSQYHPRDPADRSRNRRIEIVLSPQLGSLYDLLDE